MKRASTLLFLVLVLGNQTYACTDFWGKFKFWKRPSPSTVRPENTLDVPADVYINDFRAGLEETKTIQLTIASREIVFVGPMFSGPHERGNLYIEVVGRWREAVLYPIDSIPYPKQLFVSIKTPREIPGFQMQSDGHKYYYLQTPLSLYGYDSGRQKSVKLVSNP